MRSLALVLAVSLAAWTSTRYGFSSGTVDRLLMDDPNASNASNASDLASPRGFSPTNFDLCLESTSVSLIGVHGPQSAANGTLHAVEGTQWPPVHTLPGSDLMVIRGQHDLQATWTCSI